ncbi:MAG: ATP-binding protein [Actinomycetota bacterium]|nr:ATP-binding protein [Actinomycetota bacterium]
MAIRVVLIDDVGEYRRLVRLALRMHGGFEVVGEAADGTTAAKLVGMTRPDVVVLDLGLPDLPGREVVTRVRAACPESAVVVFTGTYLDDSLGVSPFVESYVLKDTDLDVLAKLLAEVGSTPEERTPAVLRLSQDHRSAAQARRFVQDQCAGLAPDFVDAAMLVVTELVTNAVTHADSDCEVRLYRAPGRVRVEVDDGGSGSPDVQAAQDRDEHGRGLMLVSALSAAWGVAPLTGGAKKVWADLLVDGPAAG